MGVKVVTDFDAAEGDTLVFRGHSVGLETLTQEDWDNDGNLDTVLTFVSVPDASPGAHDGDLLGTIVFLEAQLEASEILIDTNVFFGVEDPYSAIG